MTLLVSRATVPIGLKKITNAKESIPHDHS